MQFSPNLFISFWMLVTVGPVAKIAAMIYEREHSWNSFVRAVLFLWCTAMGLEAASKTPITFSILLLLESRK